MTGLSTGLSPEWDRWFDEEFTDLVSSDDDLIRAEFDDLINTVWSQPPAPPAPPAALPPGPGPDPAASGEAPTLSDDHAPGTTTNNQRSPPTGRSG